MNHNVFMVFEVTFEVTFATLHSLLVLLVHPGPWLAWTMVSIMICDWHVDKA